MKRKPTGRIQEEPGPPPESYDEGELRLRRRTKKRVVGKYKPSRHSR